ncbi:hypothetical protein ACIBP6_45590 [Nonomuraea terrae]|uniref:hypothetical protein n=1 Tax=Nonomuraea terrae TaxID=2530383 RepID=UPI0037BAFD37
MARDSRPRAPLATFLIIQAVLGCWWAAFYPGLFSRDSVLYLSHTVAGPWVSDHSVVYDALLWLSFTGTGDLGAVTFLQTTAMAGALTYLAQSLQALGAPRLLTTAVAVLMPLAPPVGAFTVTLWKDVPFTICAVAAAGVCARIAARRAVTGPALLGLAASLAALGLFRANGFLVAGVAVLGLMAVVRTARVRLLVAGGLAAALPLVLSTMVFPRFGITPASNTYVYHTAYGDIAVAYRQHPELFTDRDRALMESVAPLTRWREGGTCYTVNPLIWRRDFSWTQADARAGELLSLWRRLLVSDPATIVSARLCRGSIAWRPVQDEAAVGGGTYRLSLRPNADTYVGPGKVADFPGRSVYSLRPLSMGLNDLADRWLTSALAPRHDWALWRGASWAYLCYVSVALAAWALRNRYALAVAAVVAGQQLAVLANISAQDFRYMAAPILVGVLLVPLLLGSVARLLAELVRTRARRLRGTPAQPGTTQPEPVVPLLSEPEPEDDPTEPLPETADETDEPTEPLEEDTAPMPVPPEVVPGAPPGREQDG